MPGSRSATALLAVATLLGACANDANDHPGRRAVLPPMSLVEADVVDDGPVLLTRDISYAPGRTYDAYVPSRPGPVPALVWVHGGGWTGGSPSDIQLLDVVDQGFAVVSVAYRFAPDHAHPAAVDDIVAAVEHLRTEAAALGIDADRLVLAGHSAGAHLAFLATIRPETRVRALVATSTWVDLRIDADDPDDAEYWASSVFTAGAAEAQVTRYLGCRPVECPERALDATLLTHVDAVQVPVYLQHGLADDLIPVEETERLAAALDDGQRSVTVSLVDGMGHTAIVDDLLVAFLLTVT